MPVRTFLEADVMLLGWGDTHSRGRTVTFLLDGDGAEHPFRAVKVKAGSSHGQMFKIVMVAIDENGAPLDLAAGERPASTKAPAPQHPQAEPAPQRPDLPIKSARHFRDMPKSAQAAIKCQDEDFIEWLNAVDDSSADALIKRRLGITSKRELDIPNSRAGEDWDKLLASYEMRAYAR